MNPSKTSAFVLSLAVVLLPAGSSAQTIQTQAARPGAVQTAIPKISVSANVGLGAESSLQTTPGLKGTLSGIGVPSLQTAPQLRTSQAEISAPFSPAAADVPVVLGNAGVPVAAPIAQDGPAALPAAAEAPVLQAQAPGQEAGPSSELAPAGRPREAQRPSLLKRLVNTVASKIGLGQVFDGSQNRGLTAPGVSGADVPLRSRLESGQEVAGLGILPTTKPVLLPNGALPDAPPTLPDPALGGQVTINSIDSLETVPDTQVPGIFDAGPVVLQADPMSETAIEAALRALVDAESARFGVPSSDLQTVHVKRVAGRNHQADTIYAYFRQQKDGYVVRGSYAGFTVKVIKGKPVVLASTAKLFPKMAVDTSPRFTEPELRNSAIGYIGINPQQMGLQMEAYGQQIIYMAGTWRAVQLYIVEGLPFMIAVDVVTGRAFAWDSRAGVTEGGSLSGKIEGRAGLGAQTDATVPVTVPMGNMSVTLSDGKTVQTDAQGRFTTDATKKSEGAGDQAADTTKKGDITFTATLSGKYVEVQNQAGKTMTVSGTLKPGEEASVVYNPQGKSEEDVAQVNAYYHVNRVREWTKARGIEDSRLEKAIKVKPNIDDECNAYYTPGWPSLNFFKSSVNCVNSSFDSVIYHEWGHFMDDMIGGIVNGGLSEGWGDILSMFITANPIVGEGFLKQQTPNYVRHGENDHQYQEYDEVHDQGQVWMGFAWKLRKALIASLGEEAGAAMAEVLIMPTLYSKAADIPTAIAQVLLNDMDANGNIPHEAEIRAAAKAHGVTVPKSPGPAGLFTYASHVVTEIMSVGQPTGPEFVGVPGAQTVTRAKITFTAGALLRGRVRRELERFLDQQDGVTYRLKEYKGWLSSDFLLTIEGPDERVREVSSAIQSWFNSLETNA
ncbi:MAG: hypothetical protein HY927_02510 [Elusimicrobia bacterium]|nr:hypothetical protein [Elusimicrobiota bacterium]